MFVLYLSIYIDNYIGGKKRRRVLRLGMAPLTFERGARGLYISRELDYRSSIPFSLRHPFQVHDYATVLKKVARVRWCSEGAV